MPDNASPKPSADAAPAEKKRRLAELERERQRLEAELNAPAGDGLSATARPVPPPRPKRRSRAAAPAATTAPAGEAIHSSAGRPAAVAAPLADAIAPSANADDNSVEAADDEAETAEWEFRKRGVAGRVLRVMPAWLISLIVHMAILLAMALYTFANLDEALRGVLMDVTQAEPEEAIVELTEIEIVELAELDDVREFSPEAIAMDPSAIAFGDLGTISELSDTDAVSNISLEETSFDEIGLLFGKDGAAMADVGDGLKAAASFFGTKSTGQRFVFVVDNSNSMGGGRFETALMEMVRTIDSLGPQQQFYVIFFSDTAYRLFHPHSAPGWVNATDSNKERLKAWLYTVEMCLQTRGEEAIKAALALNPDVVYILGDGAFTDRTAHMLTVPHNRTTPIHTVGMEVDSRGEKQLTAIAAANHGTYRLVRASPAAQMMAKQRPIPKNRTRGPVWGLNLGATR